MSRSALTVGMAQRIPLALEDPLAAFRDDVARTLDASPEIELLVYPELHLHGTEHLPEPARERAAAEASVTIDDPFVRALGAIAADFGIWLCPGSINERGPGEAYSNTQLLFAPSGELAGVYRKMFPWRPFEPHRPGTEFEVVDLGGHGSAGLSICYDAWFPEHSRQLAWLGADVVLNIVKTTSPDREQELVLARANAIVNQNYVVSVNCADPVGRGRSIAVDPEGHVLAEAGLGEDTLVIRVDRSRVSRIREQGTAGTNRVWKQFQPGDQEITLPLYAGRIDPAIWEPGKR